MMKKSKNSRRLLMVLLICSILAISLSSCATTPVVEDTTPNFRAVRPLRPVLEAVTLIDPVPSSFLRNFNAVVLYSMDLEDYATMLETHIKTPQ
jgi:hypothetical protein